MGVLSGFVRFFLVVGNNSGLRFVRVQILLKKSFLIFFAHPEKNSVFSVSRQSFLEFFLKTRKGKKKIP
jgi:hypothetical protein